MQRVMEKTKTNDMQEKSRLIELEPPKYLDKLILHWYKDMGWLVEFWIGKNIAGRCRYIITKEWVIYGVFTAMKEVEKLKAPQYLFTSGTSIEEVTNEISSWPHDKWKQMTKDASTEHPIITEVRKLMELSK